MSVNLNPIALAAVLLALAGIPAPAAQTVFIASITPDSGPIGTSVTVTGSGFTSDNIVRFGQVFIKHVKARSRGSLVFSVPTIQNPSCFAQGCRIVSQPIAPRDYPVSVQNKNGVSNVVTFSVR